MSDATNGEPTRPEDGHDDSIESVLPAAEEQESTARAASLRLRTQEESGERTIDDMHAANESLAAAFRTMFRLLQVAIVGLVVVYGVSGIKAVDAGQRGIKTRFGEPLGTEVSPGITFAWPYPIGQLIRVETGQRTLQLEEEFWFEVREQDRNLPFEQLARLPSRSLNPVRDGSLLTSDQNLVHTQWTIVYRRADPTQFAQNIAAEDEEAIVRSAVQRGVIRAVSATTIDDLLRSAAGAGGVAARAQRVAQETLDAVDSGLIVESLVMRQRTPPMRVWNAFTEVQGAETAAQTARVSAESFAQKELNRVAGPAAGEILRQIDRYEAAVELGDDAEQALALDTVRGLLHGDEVLIDGDLEVIPVSGEVTQILNEAERQRVEVAQAARRMLRLYEVKQAQFLEDPDLVVRRDWAEAMTSFLERETVTTMMVPPGVLRLALNLDPETQRRARELEQERLNEEAADRRERRLREEAFRTDTGRRELDGG
ncbi:MAG: SPFH domain-containing protein [Planctomycetota bacterium]